MAAEDRRDEVAAARADLVLAEREISRAAAVLDRLETRADRAGRGVDDPDTDSAVTAFERYLTGTDDPGVAGDRAWAELDRSRPAELSYLTAPLLEDGSALGGSHDPATTDSEAIATGIETVVSGSGDAASVVADFETLVDSGDAGALAALVGLFERVVAAARAARDDARARLNGSGADPGGTATTQTSPDGEGSETPGAGGALGAFFEAVTDELSLLDDEPIALLPVRLETRFVTPNDGEPPTDGGRTTTGTDTLENFNRTDPPEEELRIRVYPDQVHVDSHEPELTATEERWGRTFWAQLWFACHPHTTVDGEPAVRYDEAKLPEDLTGVVGTLAEDWADRFSTDDGDRHAEITERAWGQLVERFGTERAAWLVHALAPETGTAMLSGWADGTAPWDDRDEPPWLALPDLDARPGSWARPPRARLLPERWLVVGRYRPADDPDADTTTVRVTGPPIQQPLPVGPNPERVPDDDGSERPGHVPEGMEWMADWPAARDVGMGLTVTAADLDGTDPGSVVFEELLVVGVAATMDRADSTDALRSLLGAHHYTDGLELLRRGTPTNNHDVQAGYRANERPEDTLGVECGPALSEFGDFSDGDLLSRALGIAEPDGSHVFAHVDGADARSQAAARHMNAALWPGTIGYFLRNVLVDNQLADEESLWGDQQRVPGDPLKALGDRLKSLDAWRRHFVRYVRAGGPFPPIRVGRQPYGILPAERLWSGDDGSAAAAVAVPGERSVSTAAGDVTIADRNAVDFDPESLRLDERGEAGTTDPAGGAGVDTETPADAADSDDDTVQIDGTEVGEVSATGYSTAVPQRADQIDADLYGSSFDPVSPTSNSDSLRRGDGGRPATYLRHRSFRVDAGLPGEIRTWLDRFTGAWEAATDSVDTVDDDEGGPELVERILGREAAADRYVREGIWGVDDAGAVNAYNTSAVTRAYAAHQQSLRTLLSDNEMDALDPRLAHLLPSGGHGLRQGPPSGDYPAVTVASDRAPHYLSYLHGEDPEFLRDMGISTPIDKLNPDREALKTALGYGDGIDDLTDAQLVVDVILREPEWNEHGVFLLAASSMDEDGLNVGTEGWDTPHGRKVQNLGDTDGDSFQHTLFKQLTRFSTLQAYAGARTRLGVKHDERDLLSELSARYAPDESGSGPVPERVFHDADTTTVWDELQDDPPRYADYDSYGELLHETCRPGADEPAVDPRLREVLGSLEALESQSASDLRRLLTETLDTASHRLDAWWTSLATRRLYEHREAQEVDLYDGADYEYVGDHFERREGTQDPDSGGTTTGTVTGQPGLAGDGPPLRGATEYGNLENLQSSAAVGGGLGDLEIDATETTSEPATYVGAYGVVQDLHSDTLDDQLPGTDSAAGGAEAEYLHAPSPDHARTAAILRSGRRNHAEDDALRELLDIDLSPGRVRAARWVLQGVRQGQQLGELLGYRFERRLRERSAAYNDANPGTINLVQYKFALRAAYPAVEGQLDHGEGEAGGATAGIGSESAKSDVVDGYRLLTEWQDTDESTFLGAIDYTVRGGTSTDLGEPGTTTTLDAALSGDEREAFAGLLDELDAIIDAVTHLLLSESVHQLGKGNFERAGGTIDDLVKGRPVAEPEVAQTPREDVGVTHRLGVVLGDPADAETREAWAPESGVVDPDGLPTVGGTSGLTGHPIDADLSLQARPDGEPALDAWLGDLLPDPDRVSCGATLRWSADRDAAVGSLELPTDPGRVGATGLDFAPDLVMLTIPHVTGDGAAGHYGWTHALALRGPDGGVDAVSTSVGHDADDTEGSAAVDDDGLTLVYHGAPGGEISGAVSFEDDGFVLDLATVDLPEGAQPGATVTYRAYALGNAATAEVGTFTTDPAGADQSVPLGVDADHVVVLGNTAATGPGVRRTGDGVGLSHGAATAGPAGIDQYALGSSVDPATGSSVAGVHEGEVLHLPSAGGGGVAGATAATVDSLGTSLDLSYGATYTGSVADASRAVAYLAIETPDRVDPPAVGVLDGTRSESDQLTVTTGFEPGAIEFVTAPDLDSTGSDAAVGTGGFAHGAALGLGRQFGAAHVTRPGADGVVGAGRSDQGTALSIPALAADGTVSGHDELQVTGRSADGFTVRVPSVVDGDQVVGYRAWPAAPEEITHSVETGISLSELALSPLDAVSLSQTNQSAGASQLEQRMHYALLRDPPASEPPVPDDAVVELTFAEAGPEAAADPVPVGAFLETVRELEQLVADGRPLDAADLGHPDEVEDGGHTAADAGELSDRADDAQDRLAAAGELVENRVSLLSIPEDAPEGTTRITEAVTALREAVSAVDREVPIDGVTAVADRVASALSADQDVLLDELDTLAAHLPAGPLDPDTEPDVAVTPRPGQELELATTRPDAEVTVTLCSTSGVEWFEQPERAETGPEGILEGTVDCSGLTPGASFAVLAQQQSSLLGAATGRVLPPAGPAIAPAADQQLRFETDLEAGTTTSVTVATDDGTQLASESVDTEFDGSVAVTVDASAIDPWTCFEATVTVGQETPVERVGIVEGRPERVLAETDVLGPLLWLADRTDAVDPHGDEGPSARLHEAVADLDWDAVRTECSLMAELHDATGGDTATPGAADVEAVAALLETAGTDLESWDPADGALEALDLTAVDAAVAAVSRSIAGLAVDRMFDVTGRPDRAGGLTFWADRKATQNESVLTRFGAFRSDPAGALDEARPEAAIAPALSVTVADHAAGAFPRGLQDATRLLAYLQPVRGAATRLAMDGAVQAELADPAGLVRNLHAVSFHPEAAPTGGDRSTFLADLRRLCRTDVLDGALYTGAYATSMAAATGLETMLATAVPSQPYYRDPSLGGGEQPSADDSQPPSDTDTDGQSRGDDGQSPGDDIDLVGGVQWEPQTPDLRGVDPATLHFGSVEGPEDTPQGSPLSDFRYLLDRFRQHVLPAYFGGLDDGSLPPDTAASRSQYATALTDRATTLEDTVGRQLDNLNAGRDAGAFDVSFRRGVLETLRRGLLRVSYFGVYGATPQSPRGGTVDDMETLLGQARGVLATVRERYERADDLSPTGQPTVDGQVQRLEALFGDDFTVLPTFRPQNGGELSATFGRSDSLQGGDPLAAETWLQRIARVRDRPATFRRAMTYTESLSRQRHRDLRVGQLPHREGELWVGLDGQAPEPGRTSLVAQYGAAFDGNFSNGPVAGLFVGEHVENVPTETETTGVALRYDDPDVTAPQSILLALPPDGGGWSRTALEDVVTDTYRLMQLRMVDLQDLGTFGPLLPMLTFPNNDAADPDTPSMNVDLIRRYDSLAPNPATIENFWGEDR